MVPWELQQPCIDLPGFIQKNPCATLKDFQQHYVHTHFGIDDPSFFTAAGLLARNVIFSDARSLCLH